MTRTALLLLVLALLPACRRGHALEPHRDLRPGAELQRVEAGDPIDVHVRLLARGRDRDGIDLEGREVRVLDSATGDVIASGTSNLSGKVPLTVPRDLFTLAAAERQRFLAVVHGAGIRGHAKPIFHGAIAMRERRLERLDVATGASFLVRFVDAEGQPHVGELDRAAISAEHGSIEARRPLYRSRESALALRSGRSGVVALGAGVHLVSWDGADAPRRLHFDVPGAGTGALDIARAEQGGESWTPRDVVLGGDARIAGCLVDGRGDPLADVPVVATWTESSRPGDVAGSGWRPAWPERDDPRAGRFFAEVRTGADGRFAMSCMEVREFVLYVSNPMASEWGREWRECARVRAGGGSEDVEIVRPSGKIHVDVRGREGAEVALELYGATEFDGTTWVSDADAWTGVNRPDRVEVVTLEGGRARRTLLVPGARPYVVVASIAGESFQSRSVSLEGVDGDADVTLDLTDARGTGEVVVTVRGGGAELHPTEFVAYAVDVETGAPVGLHRGHGDEVGPAHAFDLVFERREGNPLIIRDVPAGPARVVAEGSRHGTGFPLPVTRELGRAEAVVHVEAGGKHEVELELGPGGFLEVEVRGAIRLADQEALERRTGWFEDPGLAQVLTQGYLGARLTLHDPPRRISIPIRRVGVREIRAVNEGSAHLSQWPLGETHTSTMLPAGTYVLEATQVTREPVRMPVTVTPGEATRVIVDFSGD